MIPRDVRLLNNARSTLKNLASQLQEAEQLSLVNAVDVVLNELMLRQNKDFLLDYYRRGRQLVQEGFISPIASRATIESLSESFARTPTSIGPSANLDIVDAAIKTITFCLNELVRLAPVDQGTEEYLKRVTDWEVSLYAHRMQTSEDREDCGPDPAARFTRDAFEGYLRERFPDWRGLEVLQFSRVPGGFSKITFLLEARDDTHGVQGLAIRAEPPLKFMDGLEGSDIAREYQVLRIAYESNIPVPEPLWLEDDLTVFGMRFIVSRRASGRNFGTIKGAEKALPQSAAHDLAELLARVHNVPLEQHLDRLGKSHLLRWMQFDSLKENTRAFIQYWRDQTVISSIGVSPLVTRGLNWLAQNVPDEEGNMVLLHGDMGLHNLLIHDGKISALLDWEISRVGDPAEELTNLLSGTEEWLDRSTLMRLYEDAGGQAISEYRMLYFDVYHCMKMAICALASLRRVEDHPSASINFAVFGLQYIFYAVNRLSTLIARAEAAKPRRSMAG